MRGCMYAPQMFAGYNVYEVGSSTSLM